MLTNWEYFWIFFFFISDLFLLKSYLNYHPSHSQKKYNKKFFKLHVLGSLLVLLLAPAAFFTNYFSLNNSNSMLFKLVGACCVFLASPFAFSMARRTSGLKGFNLVGYWAYSSYWMYAGFLALTKGQINHVYDVYILGHAYLTCRIFVYVFENYWPKTFRYKLNLDWSYSIATSIAACIPLAIVWQWQGIALFSLGTIGGVLMEQLNISPLWHVSYKQGEVRPKAWEYQKTTT